MEFEERYFREELDYLRQLSKLLATEKPHLARFLAEKDADPDIERLLEGVAFLTGNLRQKIEDEFPELTHGLIKMLWPNYLRPVPAMTLTAAGNRDADDACCRQSLAGKPATATGLDTME
ncbi:hypothetical protein AB84_0220 [Escherichia coli 2-052-05_S3_C1]|nr:hypothetical protein AB84_0220 [Escherichia coli 2-052-05_S3_C1]KDV89668.1 hypothetical protein AC42_0211 [Escherichia coli 2-052-05_S3_C3]KEN80220.1 hypothetical protein AC14_0213 [Escherichia coli 2-052-05_S3_C2]